MESGKWIKAVILTESPGVVTRWAEHEDPIVFAGNNYLSLHMFWENLKASVGMPIEGSNVALSNVGNQVVKYLKTVDPSGMLVTLQLLHLDLLGKITRPFERYFKVLGCKADLNLAVFTLGREFGKNRLPRRMIQADEMP